MAFRYPLQSVLRLRLSLERHEEQKLLGLASMVASLRSEIEQFDRARLEARKASTRELAGGSFGSVLAFMIASETAAAETRRKLRNKLADAEKRRVEQLAIYRGARQKREILQGLREKLETAYERESSRHQQQRIDEAFLLRRFAEDPEK
jgi:flagellar export protein FliJ